MPPVPLDITDLTVTRKPRTRLNFGPPMTCDHNTATTLKTRDQNIQGKKTGNGNIENAPESADSIQITPVAKRRRCNLFSSTPKPEPEIKKSDNKESLSTIIKAVERLSTESLLVADGSRENVLPTIKGKHSDLNAISPETMSDILDGVYGDKMEKVTIIDCRYPYEYNGGHIKGAVNLHTKETIQKFMQDSVTSSTTNHVLIFHCEFSSERAPKMYRFLRSLDRALNKDHYPRLNFPEIYLLEGGYKAFFYSCKEKCFPQTYMPMLHKEHKEALRHFRAKSKSWSAGDRPRKASISGSGLRLRF